MAIILLIAMIIYGCIVWVKIQHISSTVLNIVDIFFTLSFFVVLLVIFLEGTWDEVNGLYGLMYLIFLASMDIGVFGNPFDPKPVKEERMKIAQENKEKERKILEAKNQFYPECKKAGIISCDTQNQISKATLIAQQLGIPFSDIVVLFEESKAAYEAKQAKERHQEIEKEKSNERNEQRKLLQYAHLTGRDKRIQMLKDRKAELVQKIQILRGGTSAVMASTQQKEIDWALHGGIASGIAGGAAGLAVAMEKQRQNQQIRAQNAANGRAFASLALMADKAISEYEDKVESLDEQIAGCAIKLVDDSSTQKCFDCIRFSNTELAVSETGTCTVEVKAKLRRDVFICNDGKTKAVVDGTIFAIIYEGEKQIGSATMVLPLYGIGTRQDVSLVGMALFVGKKGEKHSVKFEPKHLWLIED